MHVERLLVLLPAAVRCLCEIGLNVPDKVEDYVQSVVRPRVLATSGSDAADVVVSEAVRGVDASLRMIVSTQAERYAGQWKRELASMGDHGPTRTRIRGHVANFADFAQHIVHSLRLDPGDGDEPLLSYLRAYAEMLLEQEFRVASIEDLFGFYDGIRQLMAELSGRGISLTQRLRFSAPDWTFARFQAELDRRCRLALWQSLYFDPAFQRVASGAFSALTEIAGSVTGMKPIEALRIGRQLEPLRDRLDLLIEESADVADGAS